MRMLQFKHKTTVQDVGYEKQMCGIEKAYWVVGRKRRTISRWKPKRRYLRLTSFIGRG